ncbi:glycosyltransferase N-terminal domain-containing protein [Segatella maculosa]|uniref:3-deoxy-D-manno-octulosonic acid transferase n=1 Tax=Segatella maculosa TaxID=439703 RepID=UPI0028D60C3C|nr:glycosyltransferase N-terminal domain-containing protein [Segatella maculosa]
MYQIVIYLYLFGVAVASLFNKKVKKMWAGERQAIRLLKAKVDPDARYVWFHAASLGEFEQGRPLIERIRNEHPEYKILLTFFSPSGYEVRKNYDGADIICYLPLDTIRNARRFLRAVRPVMAFFIKYEFWYNYLHILQHRGVPAYSVSSIFRPDQIFFQWYGRSYGRVLKCFTRFFVQNEESKLLLSGLGITAVEVVGDTRFDRVLQIKEASKRLPLVEKFTAGAQKVFVAGSSWLPDEEIFLKYFSTHKDWKVIVAPHVVSEEHIAEILDLLKGRRVIRYSEATETNVSAADVLLIDCFGLLSSIYHYGTVSYVGGGFGVGIHNVLEAAVWDIPVIIGPNNKHFQEAQGLMTAQGGFEIDDYQAFSTLMMRFETDASFLQSAGRNAGEFVKSRVGSTERILGDIAL